LIAAWLPSTTAGGSHPARPKKFRQEKTARATSTKKYFHIKPSQGVYTTKPTKISEFKKFIGYIFNDKALPMN
jgi:hypothetical protein